MIDQGLLVSIALMLVVPLVVARVARPATLASQAVVDVALPSVFVGLAVGRLTAMALDDPTGLRRFGDILLIRGGVEMWPGLVAGLITLAIGARRAGVSPASRLAELAPYGLWVYAVYEAGCLVRDGCFGPPTAFGLRPRGIGESQLPIGLMLGGVVAIVGVVVRRLSGRSPIDAVVAALGGLAVARFLAAFWLPKIGAGPTRPQVESLVAVVVIVILGTARRVMRRRERRTSLPIHYDAE